MCFRPVKPISLFGLFFREAYHKVKEEEPTAKFGDISRTVSRQWDLLCSHQKLKYKKRIEEAKMEYKKELELHKQSLVCNSLDKPNQKGKLVI